MERTNFQRMFRSFFFGELNGGSKGGEAPLASLGCARTGCIRCKMACHFAKLAYHPRYNFSDFWRVWMWGKQPLKECCLFRICPWKNLQKSPRGMIVVLWFFAGDGWAENNALFQRIAFCLSIAGEKSLGCKVTDLTALHLPQLEIAILQKYGFCLFNTILFCCTIC